MSVKESGKNVARLIIECLEAEGVEYIFGLPGEENIDIIDALRGSKIRFILTRHEQGASFMADIYGRLTRKPGICLATLGPGALNLVLGTADAHLDSSPLIALVAQASRDRLNKESHQVIDLVALFEPITKWSKMIALPEQAPEVMRKAFKTAQTERQGAVAVVIPEDVAALPTNKKPLVIKNPKPVLPEPNQLERAKQLIEKAKNPLILAGHGICRESAQAALVKFAEKTGIAVVNTFMAKGVIPANHPLALGTIGFMVHDVINFGFDRADLVIAIGYDLIEYGPAKWHTNPGQTIVHIHNMPAEVDEAYPLEVGVVGNLNYSLTELAKLINNKFSVSHAKIKTIIHDELANYKTNASFPLKPQRIVNDIRTALEPADIVLCDTGALKMWMARLYPCYQPDTCLISNSLATMGFALPGALAAKLASPDKKVLAIMGDGSFLMNSQELETAKREKIPFVVLVWCDEKYGLIEWKQNLELGHSSHIAFTNPDFVKYAESFGIKGYAIQSADALLPTLQKALAGNELAVIACPVDYSENMKLVEKLGKLTDAI